MKNRIWILFACFFTCSSALQAQFFVKSNEETNIDHVVDHYLFMGGGAAFFDADNDGDDDLYLTSGQAMDHFYINNGDGTFTMNSEAAGFMMTDTFYTIGVIAGDIDNDGFKDLFVTTDNSDAVPKAKNLLFKNNGDGTFTEIWEENLFVDKSFTMGATFIDYNLDGLLDIYAINYVKSVAFIYDDLGEVIGFDHECYRNTMYLNQGNGNFDEESQTLNLVDGGCGLAVVATDYDMDGDMDIHVANDFGAFIEPNFLFQNNYPSPFFQSVGPAVNADIAMYGMGIAVGDIDGDLDLDYYITNFGKNRLLRNEITSFTDITDQSNVGNEWVEEDVSLAIGWGTAFLDFDNDSDLDLYVANGLVPSPGFLPSTNVQQDKLYRCEEDISFTEVTNDYGIDNPDMSRGMAYSDFDNDGDLDILSVVLNAPPNDPTKKSILFKNQMGNEKNWLKIRLEGVEVNRDAYGSKVYVHAGGETFLQELSGGSSHCSHNTSVMHFGLNDLTQVDSIDVHWTGGMKQQRLYDIEVNQTIDIIEDVVLSDRNLTNELTDIILYPNPAQQKLNVDWSKSSTTIQFSNLTVYDALGRVVEQNELRSTADRMELDLANYRPGMYFLQLSAQDAYWSRSFVVER